MQIARRLSDLPWWIQDNQLYSSVPMVNADQEVATLGKYSIQKRLCMLLKNGPYDCRRAKALASGGQQSSGEETQPQTALESSAAPSVSSSDEQKVHPGNGTFNLFV